MLVGILIAPLIWFGIYHAPSFSRGSLDEGGAGLVSAAFFTPSFLIANAATPLVDVTPPAIIIAVVMQNGHMGLSSLR
jgi:hypothetical protein